MQRNKDAADAGFFLGLIHHRAFLSRMICLGLLIFMPCFALAQESILYLGERESRPILGESSLLEVHLINVASADCILLRMGEHTMLIDSGIYRNYERITAYLRTLGVDRLEYAFASHPHDDHIGGFVGVLAEVPVGMFLEAALYDTYASTMDTRLKRLLQEKSIATRTVSTGTVMQFGEATLTFYQWDNPSAYENNRSMVLKVEYGQRSILLSSDVENNGQRALAEAYGDALKADIIKMPHHGLAPFMPEYYAVVRPSLATFSNIKDNINDVLRAVEKRGIHWMLTTKGTIVAVTDGRVWEVWQIPGQK